MFEIDGVLVSLDLAERYFCCDLDRCLGQCCVDGDAGAPITREEYERLKTLVPVVADRLSPQAREAIAERGVGYIDEEGDLVTTIIGGRDCAFTCYAPGGKCLCALDSAYREGLTDWRKPISCYLYPLRIKQYDGFTAINYHRWRICRSAETNGRRLGIRLYQAMREPLIERFGAEWYAELAGACEAWIASGQSVDR